MIASSPDPARGRFFLLQLVRLCGAAVLMLAVLVASGRIGWLAWAPAWVAYPLAGLGMVSWQLVPMRLARRWKSRQP